MADQFACPHYPVGCKFKGTHNEVMDHMRVSHEDYKDYEEKRHHSGVDRRQKAGDRRQTPVHKSSWLLERRANKRRSAGSGGLNISGERRSNTERRSKWTDMSK